MLQTLSTVVFAQAAEEEGGSFLISPNVGLMIWTLLVFALSMYLLGRFAFPRIGQALDRRQRAIEESIDAAERTKAEADRLLAEYRARLSEAREQADDIVSRARKTGEAQEAEIIAQARRKHEELLEQTRRDIRQETQAALQQIRAEVADLTLLATEKVTRKVLDDSDQKRLVEEALREMDFAALSGDRETR